MVGVSNHFRLTLRAATAAVQVAAPELAGRLFSADIDPDKGLGRCAALDQEKHAGPAGLARRSGSGLAESRGGNEDSQSQRGDERLHGYVSVDCAAAEAVRRLRRLDRGTAMFIPDLTSVPIDQ